MDKKKRIVRVVVIIAVIALIADIGLKLSLLISVKDNLKNIDSFKLSEFSYKYNIPENPITDDGITFDNKFGFVKNENVSLRNYKSDDGAFAMLLSSNNDDLLAYTKESLEEYSFAASLLFSEKDVDKFVKKNNISSYGELLLNTYKDKKPLPYLSVLYPMPLFKQELLRGIFKSFWIPPVYDVYYAEADDCYYYLMEALSDPESTTRYFQVYSKNENKSYGVGLNDKDRSLSHEELIDFFETFSFE